MADVIIQDGNINWKIRDLRKMNFPTDPSTIEDSYWIEYDETGNIVLKVYHNGKAVVVSNSAGEENVIDKIAVNNSDLPITNKRVNIDLSNYATKSELSSAGDENVIEKVAVNNSDLPITNKRVNIDLSNYAKTNDLKSSIGNATTTTSGLMSSEDKSRLDGLVSTGGEANKINSIKVNGTALTPDNNKAVNIDLSTYATKSDLSNIPMDVFSSNKNGLVPKSDGSSNKYLRADGQWSTVAGGSGGGASYDLATESSNGLMSKEDKSFIEILKENGGTFLERIPYPSQRDVLAYTGSVLEPVWDDYDNTKCAISGTLTGTEIGTYTAIFTPNEGYIWMDGTRTPTEITWKIGAANIVSLPYQTNTLYYKNGQTQSPSWDVVNINNKYDIGGTQSAEAANEYTITFTPKEGYMWSDGTRVLKSIIWHIYEPNIITLLPEQDGRIYYDGQEHTVQWANYIEGSCSIRGTLKGTSSGSYTAIFTPKESYCWSDKSRNDKPITWFISEPTKIPLPQQDGVLIYDGARQLPKWKNYIDGSCDIIVVSRADPGIYPAKFTPKEGYCWYDDSSRNERTVNWSISKAQLSVQLSENSIELSHMQLTKTINILTNNPEANISAHSNDTTICTVSCTTSDNKKYVVATYVDSGNTTITIEIEADSNYESATLTLPVTCSITAHPELKDNTPEEIYKATRSGVASSIWHIGDCIDIPLSGNFANYTYENYKITAMIVDFNHNAEYEGDNTIHFQCFNTPKYYDKYQQNITDSFIDILYNNPDDTTFSYSNNDDKSIMACPRIPSQYIHENVSGQHEIRIDNNSVLPEGIEYFEFEVPSYSNAERTNIKYNIAYKLFRYTNELSWNSSMIRTRCMELYNCFPDSWKSYIRKTPKTTTNIVLYLFLTKPDYNYSYGSAVDDWSNPLFLDYDDYSKLSHMPHICKFNVEESSDYMWIPSLEEIYDNDGYCKFPLTGTTGQIRIQFYINAGSKLNNSNYYGSEGEEEFPNYNDDFSNLLIHQKPYFYNNILNTNDIFVRHRCVRNCMIHRLCYIKDEYIKNLDNIGSNFSSLSNFILSQDHIHSMSDEYRINFGNFTELNESLTPNVINGVVIEDSHSYYSNYVNNNTGILPMFAIG